uniref:Glucoamylase n=1 Tax=Anthurium amnicola TaxID=1678845 RepID=A0A1D1YZV9_9ARAE
METVRSPCAQWLLAAGGRGRTAPAGVRGGGGGSRFQSPTALHLPASSTGAHHGISSHILLWRRATTVVPAFPRGSSAASAFPSAEKLEKADVETLPSKSPSQTATESPNTGAEVADQVPTEEPKTEIAEVVQTETSEPPKTVIEIEAETPESTTELPKIGTEAEAAEFQTQTATELPTAGTEVVTTEVPTLASSEPLQVNMESGTAEVVTQTPDVSSTVHVKFVLQKSCKFGEQFLLVGEDQMLGSWNPPDATALKWSDGHVWITEMDMPVGKEIKFKFLLRSLSGKIKWQPGPDRVLQTWETTNTIVVAGDWENEIDPKIAEEGSLVIPADGETSEESKIGAEDGEALIEKSPVAIMEESEQDKVKAEEVMPAGQKGDSILVPGLASPSMASTEHSSSEEITNWMVDGASFALGDIGTGTAEVNA